MIHIPLAHYTGLSLAGWTRPSLGRQHTLPNNPEVCEIALGMAKLRFSKFILPSIALMHLFLFKIYFLLKVQVSSLKFYFILHKYIHLTLRERRLNITQYYRNSVPNYEKYTRRVKIVIGL
jgi:hypothetical protein